MAQGTRPKDRRKQILEVAVVRFLEGGFHQTRMKDLAEQLGITAGALYRHFPNKHFLLEASFDHAFDRTTPDFEQPLLETILRSHTRKSLRGPDSGLLWARESRNLSPEVRERMRARLRETNRSYARHLRARNPSLDDVQARLIAWSMQAVIASPGRHNTSLPTDKYVDELVCMCLAMADLSPPPLSSPRPKLPTGLRVESTRERVIAAATKIFSEHGFENASMQMIGEEAGVSGQALYSYFDSKLALFRAGMARGLDTMWVGLHSAMTQSSNEEEGLENIVATHVRVALSRPTLLALLVDEPRSIDEVDWQSQNEFIKEWQAVLRRIRPELSAGSAAVHVHAALAIIHDLTRESSLIADAAVRRFLTAQALAALRA